MHAFKKKPNIVQCDEQKRAYLLAVYQLTESIWAQCMEECLNEGKLSVRACRWADQEFFFFVGLVLLWFSTHIHQPFGSFTFSRGD